MTLAYFDCFSGASGDMILGALVDAGVSLDRLRARLARLPVAGYALSATRTTKGGLAATQVRVELEPGPAPHRHLRHVVDILQSADLPTAVRDGAVRVFTRLAEAEARAHGTSIEKVHFHEVGAIDAIVDVAGALLGLDELGVTRVVCSPIPTGSGTVRCAHGVLPVPAPATVALLEGVPLLATDEPGELTTPTGAAILTTVAESYGPLPGMRIERWGYGAGCRDGVHRPNLLRVLVGEPTQDSGADEVVILESNLDDISSETIGFCMGKLLDGGALDVYAVPITMKKSRPGVILTVLARPADVARIEELMFRETTTFGIRRYRAERQKLERRHETVETGYGPIRIKIGSRAGAIYTTAPEYEDCRQAAETHGVPLRAVLRAAAHAWDARRNSDAAPPA